MDPFTFNHVTYQIPRAWDQWVIEDLLFWRDGSRIRWQYY